MISESRKEFCDIPIATGTISVARTLLQLEGKELLQSTRGRQALFYFSCFMRRERYAMRVSALKREINIFY